MDQTTTVLLNDLAEKVFEQYHQHHRGEASIELADPSEERKKLASDHLVALVQSRYPLVEPHVGFTTPNKLTLMLYPA
ncbi:hypothetical protein [Pseudomonas turukhanskensis]|uniref:Uncharacterized protein n=1 Tax=Pseudomonas turukhanskensis TaxID=1806536 RepID=A0A9W6K5D7_9PSED|nr:hypothetical protein [Pseudomonas turukhanskensis]GLK88304.1 hypothetical protein GCM10017655_13660 [Pseudomonas turukhanskensis]